MKKKVLSLILAGSMVISMAACGSTSDGGQTGTGVPEVGTVDQSTFEGDGTEIEGGSSSELVDGKFAETRHITVEVYDRGNDGGTDPTNNMYTDYIKKGMLEDHNVEVEFVAVPRWTEVDEINNLLAAGTAPDICLTYSYPTIQTYADMGGVIDLQNLVVDNKNDLPNLWNWLGTTNMYWDKSVTDGTLWALEGKRANNNRIVTFVRQDWLDTLGLDAPTTKEEFYQMLCAFRDNADTLLGADAKKMIPFSCSSDIGWRAALLIESCMDPAITDKEFYVNGFDDRKYTQNGAKDAGRILNQWYNEGLMMEGFALTESSDEDSYMKAGYVGAFMHNYDYPFRGDTSSMNYMLTEKYGQGARYIAINCFKDSSGKYTKFHYAPVGSDRKIFFPTTNDEPLASLLYLDFISDANTIEYLQTGEAGINHHKVGEAIVIDTVGEENIQYYCNSPKNIDYTMTCNGLHLSTEEITRKSFAYAYSAVDPADVENAVVQADLDKRYPVHVSVGTIVSEGEGTDLSGKRDAAYDNAVTCKPADFDKVWDAAMKEYLAAGGQAIMDERKAAWEATYGSKVNLD